jgi:predicted ATPase
VRSRAILDRVALVKLNADQRTQLKSAVALSEVRGERRFTQWRVLSGAPGSGKSTIADLLVQRGERVVEDPARTILQRDVEDGTSPGQSRRDYRQFQLRVLEQALATMHAINPQDLVFFDYGVAESLAFLRAANLNWDKAFVEAAASISFARVFVLDPLNLNSLPITDPVRTEDEILRQQLHGLIVEIYALLGVRPVRIPVMSPQERLALILRGQERG